LLAKALCHSAMFKLNHRLREQARSHISESIDTR